MAKKWPHHFGTQSDMVKKWLPDSGLKMKWFGSVWRVRTVNKPQEAASLKTTLCIKSKFASGLVLGFHGQLKNKNVAKM